MWGRQSLNGFSQVSDVRDSDVFLLGVIFDHVKIVILRNFFLTSFSSVSLVSLVASARYSLH